MMNKMARVPNRRDPQSSSPTRVKLPRLNSSSPQKTRTSNYSSIAVSKSIELGRKPTLLDFQVFRTIGVGSFARVKLAKKRTTGEIFVLKVMAKSDIKDKGQTDNVTSELMFLRRSSSPFIVRFFSSFQSRSHLFIVLEYLPGGELYTYLRQSVRFELPTTRIYLAQVISAISYVHSRGFAYRDLKPENILLTAAGRIKLVDFGFVKRLNEGERTKSMCGTPEYMAPEVISRIGHDAVADWWGIGILLYEMMLGQTPFVDDSPYEIYNNILQKEVSIPPTIDPSASDLISRLLQKNPLNRITEPKIKVHKFFSSLNWSQLAEMPVPYTPQLTSASDSSAFAAYSEEQPGKNWPSSNFNEFCC